MKIDLKRIFDFNFFNKYWYIYISILAALVSQFLYRITVIDNKSSVSHVSVIAGLNFWYWILFPILLFIIFIKIKDHNFESISLFILHSSIGIVVGFNISGALLSLSGTPMTFADVRGDLGAYVELAEKAKFTGFSGFYYPPIYVSLIGYLSNIFSFPVIGIFKPFDLLLFLISPILIIFLYSKFLQKWMALTLTLYLSVNSYFDWKNLAFYLVIGQIFLIIYKRNVSIEKTESTWNISRGIFFGFFVLIYFGHLWWSIVALLIISLILLFSYREYANYQLNSYIGFFIVVGPFFGQQIFRINAFYILISILTFAFIIQFIPLIEKISLILFPIIFIGVLVFFRTGDTWVQGAIQSQDPTLNIFGNFSYSNLFILLFIFSLILYLTNKNYNKYHFIVYLSILLILSGILMMYYFASRMQVTEKIELWPRAYGHILGVYTILTVIVFTSIFIETFKTFVPEDFYRISLVFISVILLFPISQSLSSKIYGTFPTFSNGAWFAHQACSNPHEDPMLAKVFETKPHIQYFLRFNCPKVNWPYIKVAYNGPKNMLMNPYATFYNQENSKFNWKIFL